MWVPRPRDTSRVALPDEVMDLVETLAEHAHDVWAATRWREGWRYGPERDDVRKLTPNMVPYRDLPPDEQRLDREMPLEALRLITSLGYRLARRTPDGAAGAGEAR